MSTSPHRNRRGTENPPDEVILLDDQGVPLGSAPRLQVHSTQTPLHLAFSTYIMNSRGEVLITRRALSKKTWPGVWTNSCCGHPRPGEAIEDAARRRIKEELGLTVGPLTPLLPDFRYQAVDASGIVENEICPVFAGWVTDQDPDPDPAEVAEWAWVSWPNLVAAAAATPQVYSPWAALQIPQLNGLDKLAASSEVMGLNPAQTIADVDALLAEVLSELSDEWLEFTAGMGVDVLAKDLPAWLQHHLLGRGKRLRIQMAFWGFIAAGGQIGSASYQDLVRVAAALETLHFFALVHDDVMDGSESRRGRPSLHAEAREWHKAAGALGDAETFGRNLAILLGDLAHSLADRLVSPLNATLREHWYQLNVELIAGQGADLTGAAARRRDRAHAEQVARLKTGRYSVVRPLQLGAAAAGSKPSEHDWLIQCGEHLGHAFAMRDDYLGIWGDPELTGKPAGDDLIEAKATVLLDIARDRLTGPPKEALERIGTVQLTPTDISLLTGAMREAGVAHEVDRVIKAEVEAAAEILAKQQLDDNVRDGIQQAMRALAWRRS